MKSSRQNRFDMKSEVDAKLTPSNDSRLVSKSTGPRTKQGKQRASRNAIKHAIFSKVIILKDESRTEYDGLVARLWEALRPEGALEELLAGSALGRERGDSNEYGICRMGSAESRSGRG